MRMKLFTRVTSSVMALSLWLGAFALDTNPAAVSGLLDRIGGTGTSDRFITVVDESLADNGKETFVITASEGKPCVKGSTLSALTTGIGWYLNHYANVNLTWNCPKLDLSSVNLPLPSAEERHSSDAAYRYYLNYCTFSYSMSTWTWDRWQEEIDWMALRGINMPLQIIGVEEVWRKFLMDDYGYSQSEVNDYVAGPCFMAWFGMNNLEGWGGPNPDWWYKRQAQLGKQIGDRMRSLGIEPVLPGFAQLPSNFTTKTGIKTVDQGNWCGFKRPRLANPNDAKFDEVAAKFYNRVKDVLGESRYYSMDPFHEGGSVNLDAATVYKRYYEAMEANNPGSKWVIQSWQWNSKQTECINNVPVGKLIVLDLYADGRPNWGSYGQQDVVYSTIFNFGGRSGYFGRVQAVIDGYWNAKTSKSTVKGIGAAPEAIEQTPVAYDLLFELPWYDSKPDAAQWFADYSTRRYGVENAAAAEAWEIIRSTTLDCKGSGQGPQEAILCARPNLDGRKVSTWGFDGIFYDPQVVAQAAYKLLNAGLDGENYSFDLCDQTRQALSDYARQLMEGIKAANASGDTDKFNARRAAFLQLILDLDEVLNTNTEFMLGHWTQRARDMANEVEGTTQADRDWLELNNARTLISTWGDYNQAEGGQLRDYSYREWGGMLKDYYYERWKYWFDHNMTAPDGGWFNWEWKWAHNNPGVYPTTPVGDTRETVARILPKYLSPFTPKLKDAEPYYVPRMIVTDKVKKIYDKGARDVVYVPDFDVSGTEIAEIAIDFSKNGIFDANEITVGGTGFHIPADAPIGERVCRITLADCTQFSYTLQIVEDITEPRTVSVATSDAAKGTVSIEGADALSVTNTDPVVLRAHATPLYDFSYWEDQAGNNAGNDNPMTYYGKEAAAFTAHFVNNKWGVPETDASDVSVMRDNKQYVKTMSVTQNGETTKLFETEDVPEEQFICLTQRIKAAPGGEFSFDWTDAGGLKWLFLTAFADLNADGTFEMTAPEFLGKYGAYHSNNNPEVAAGHFRVLLPFDAPNATTHLRMRFDSPWFDAAWNSEYECFNPKAKTNRQIYEILLEVNDAADYVTKVTVNSCDERMGTVRSENSTNMYNPGEKVILTAFANPGYRFVRWEDQYGRTLPEEWRNGNSIVFTAYDNADITAVFERMPLEVDGWSLRWGLDPEGRSYIAGVEAEGEPSLDLSAKHNAECADIDYILPAVFAGNTVLRSVTVPEQQFVAPGDLIYMTETVEGNGAGQVISLKLSNGTTASQSSPLVEYKDPFVIKIDGFNNGNTYNQYGSVIFANGNNGLADNYSNGWSQVYLKADGTVDIKWDSASAVNFPVSIVGKFHIVIEYLGNKKTRFTIYNASGESVTKTLSNSSAMQPVWRFATNMPVGMNVTVSFCKPDYDVTPGTLFSGCCNLTDFHVAQDCAYAVEKDGMLYEKASPEKCIAYPEGRLYGTPIFLASAAGAPVGALPVMENGNATDTKVTAKDLANPLAAIWRMGADNTLTHANSGLQLGTKGTTLGTASGKFACNLVYGTTSFPGLEFANLSNSGKYLTCSNGALALSSKAHVFSFTPVTEVKAGADAGYPAAVCFPVDVVAPADGNVKGLSSVDNAAGGTLLDIPAGMVIPAGQPVIVVGGNGSFAVSEGDVPPAALTGNILKGTTVALRTQESFYLLEGDRFVRHDGGVIPENTSYILADANLTAESFRYDKDSALPELADGPGTDEIYNLRGQRIGRPATGINIINGIKTVVR